MALRKRNLRESVKSPPGTVDRDSAIVRSVKILGLNSQNGRRYTPEAIRKAKKLYENRSVNINHPDRPRQSRSAEDRIGKLINIRVREDGLFGDLVLLKSHPMTERILEAAERMPDLFGLSHNADGKVRTERNGIEAVEDIIEVRSVDLVAEPATNKSLFESHRSRPTMKLRELLEMCSHSKQLPRWKRRVLLEMPDEFGEEFEGDDEISAEPDPALDAEVPAPEVSAEEPEVPVDPMTALQDGFSAALQAIATDATINKSAKLKKIKEILDAEEKLMADTEPVVTEEDDEEPVEEEDKEEEETVEEDCENKSMKESKKHKKTRGVKAISESHARQLCDLAGVRPAPELLESLQAMNSVGAAVNHMKWLKENTRQGYSTPRSSYQTSITESRNGGFPKTREELIKALRSGKR